MKPMKIWSTVTTRPSEARASFLEVPDCARMKGDRSVFRRLAFERKAAGFGTRRGKLSGMIEDHLHQHIGLLVRQLFIGDQEIPEIGIGSVRVVARVRARPDHARTVDVAELSIHGGGDLAVIDELDLDAGTSGKLRDAWWRNGAGPKEGIDLAFPERAGRFSRRHALAFDVLVPVEPERVEEAK